MFAEIKANVIHIHNDADTTELRSRNRFLEGQIKNLEREIELVRKSREIAYQRTDVLARTFCECRDNIYRLNSIVSEECVARIQGKKYTEVKSLIWNILEKVRGVCLEVVQNQQQACPDSDTPF